LSILKKEGGLNYLPIGFAFNRVIHSL
jgi:hypothetical protein